MLNPQHHVAWLTPPRPGRPGCCCCSTAKADPHPHGPLLLACSSRFNVEWLHAYPQLQRKLPAQVSGFSSICSGRQTLTRKSLMGGCGNSHGYPPKLTHPCLSTESLETLFKHLVTVSVCMAAAQILHRTHTKELFVVHLKPVSHWASCFFVLFLVLFFPLDLATPGGEPHWIRRLQNDPCPPPAPAPFTDRPKVLFRGNAPGSVMDAT